MSWRRLQVETKYVIDRIVAALMLILLAPIFAIIAMLIKLDDGGPILFCQDRLGLNGRLFRIWKFRSMVPDADRWLDAQGHLSSSNRVTRIGRILRKVSLDELPQLINTIRGEMSLVGPRAVLPEHLARYTERQKMRLRIKPGVTGLAQVNGRNNLPWSKRIEYDLWYIENYSWWLDATILVRTVKVVLWSQGVVLDRNPEQVDDLAPAALLQPCECDDERRA